MNQNLSAIPVESSLYSQIGMAFFCVIAVILFLAWIIKRIGWKKSTKQFIDVKATYNISAKERILLVYVDHQLLVVGVTAQQMTLLHTINEQRTEMLLAEPADVEQLSKSNLFNQILLSVLDKR
ncbi:flagellar biosynthetic protein FliO [Gilliamella sp. B2889]|uniref:flagellar biosynthetic protein FliO n=1 Tax=Gilliamella sp. B2889 TaxID=2817985 RepID=UPI00226A1A8F|nr:flagellar biosynthetic protein FliO [Gilliamella sp. B2889]MCX8683760.1 flagellar biosynthetic protein FliO [Gilliamella sp. B2889]